MPCAVQNLLSDAPPTEALRAGLYIVATPIGNLGDITLRAIDTLKRCDAIACEDTRVTGKLLNHLGIAKPMWRYDDHTEGKDSARVAQECGHKAIALVSDAGTPLVSDPGYRLVRAVQASGHPITTIPGACAAVAALTLSGIPSDRFLFAGFVPAKEKARRDMLQELAATPASLVLYDTGPRVCKTLAAIAAVLPGRDVAVARELTKLHEECRRGPADELLAWYTRHPPKGEIVLLVAPPEPGDFAGDPDRMLGEALMTMKPSQAAAQVARLTGLDRKRLYARAMELKP